MVRRRNSVALSQPSLWRTLRFALALCFVVAGGLVLSAGRASAAEGVSPVIGDVTATEVAEHEVKVEAPINPGSLETAYEIRLVWQLPDPPGGPPANAGEGPTGGPQTQTGKIAAGSGYQTVSATFTGLRWGYIYDYVVVASNSACGKAKGEFGIALHISGEFPNGEGTGRQYESESPCWYNNLSNEESAKTLKEYEVKHAKELEAQHAKEHEEQEFKEAVARAAEAAARKQREEQEQDKGGLSLAGTNVTVKGDGVALVKLECLGIAACRGKLTLTAKIASKPKGKKRPGPAATIGTVSFSVAGDETKALKVDLNAAGRALLIAADGRVDASLAILELAPSPQNTQTKTVQLVQEKTHGARPRRISSMRCGALLLAGSWRFIA
jgi:hypothetical protein